MWTNFKAAQVVELVECTGELEKRQEEEGVKGNPGFLDLDDYGSHACN